MVRGRRTRVQETTSSTVTLTVNGTQFSDDQYCASPKRKDCRIDEKKRSSSSSSKTTLNKQNSKLNGTIKLTGGINGFTNGTNCGYQRQIKDMFRTTTRSKSVRSVGAKSSLSALDLKCSQSVYSNNNIKNDCIKRIYANNSAIHNYNDDRHVDDDDNCDGNNNDDDDDDENDNDDRDNKNYNDDDELLDKNILCPIKNEIYNDADNDIILINDDVNNDNNNDDTVITADNNVITTRRLKQKTQRQEQKQHQNKNTTKNIFLQEPVLSLNVDKSPNQPSSIKINKTLEVESVFPSNNIHSNLDGQFNKIVTLNTLPNDNDNKMNEIANDDVSTINSNSILLNNTDSNSCDSGVVIDTSNLNNTDNLNTINRRRKPATPHRILCPSPVKYSITSTALTSPTSSSSSSSSITNGSCQSITAKSCFMNAQQKRHPKSKRRLNTNHYENNSMTSPQLIGGVTLSTDTLKRIDYSNNDHNNTIMNQNQKTILNSAKNPTAEENTNNNYKSYHPPITNGNQQQQQQQRHNNNHHQYNNPKELKTSITNSIDNTVNNNKKLTDYFPVRRSVRKTKRVVQEEIMKDFEKAVLEEREDGLKVENFDDKGRGVIADRLFKRGEFVVEYIGDLITMSEANQREKKYSLDENAGCYMYYFKHKNQQYCIDATFESGKLGRLVNHSRNGNLITKIVVVKNRPHLILIAKDDIQPGEELTYDYGDRSKESLIHHPWLAL